MVLLNMQIIKDNQKEKHKLKHIISSFFYGGVIGMFAQGLYELFLNNKKRGIIWKIIVIN